jgi:glucosamine kinase
MTRIVIGVDCGGTRARAVVLDAEGRELARAERPGAVATAAAPEHAVSAVARVCREAAKAAGAALPVDAVWAGVTGAGREASRSAVELELSRAGVAGRVHVGTDGQAAFHDIFGDGAGVLLIAGTGSIAFGRAEDGREGRVGGWGHHIGDEGSGYAIGLEALRRVARSLDGRDPETSLVRVVLGHLSFKTIDEVVTWMGSASKSEVAALAPIVAFAADRGDITAREIQVQAVEELEGHVLAILENLGPWSTPPGVAFSGGLLGTGSPLRGPLARTLARQRITVLDTVADPAMGAGRLALAMV